MTTRIVPRADNEKPNGWVLEMMRERGSVCGLRYPYAHRIESIVDVIFEECSPKIFLATPQTPEGVEWLRRSFQSRTEHVWFCNSYVLRHAEYCRLIQNTPDDICHQHTYLNEQNELR